MSEIVESQRLECVCGKNLRIPADASAKANRGKCPRCQAPFEFLDGKWVCVATKVSASTALEPEQELRAQLPKTGFPLRADESDLACNLAQRISPVTTELPNSDDKPLSIGRPTVPELSTISNETTDSPIGQQEAAEATSLHSTLNGAEEVLSNLRVPESSIVRASSLKQQSVSDETYYKKPFASEVPDCYITEKSQTDPSNIENDVTSTSSGFATDREDLMETASDVLNLTGRIRQETTSLGRFTTESATAPSTKEMSCESNTYGHVSSTSSTESQIVDRYSQAVCNSDAPVIATKVADDYCCGEGASPQPSEQIQRIESQSVADDVRAKHYHSDMDGTVLVGECTAEAQVGINQRIRTSLATSLGLGQRYPEHVLEAITLACHPWPDCEISQNEIDSVAAELLPGFNINHPSMLEIAIDRLLRFQDVLQFQGSTKLAASYAAAALAIDSFKGINAGEGRDDELSNQRIALIASPIGLTTTNSNSISTQINDSSCIGGGGWHSTIVSLLGSAVLRGSRDTGIALGSDETGVSVCQLADNLGVELPEKQFDDYLDTLDDRVLDILTSRTFTLGLSDTLDDIATRWKITRERVRQIETSASEKLRDRFTATFKRLGKQSIAPLSCHVFRVDILYAIATRIAGYSRHREILSGFLANIFGPWRKTGHWIYHSSLQDRVEQLRDALVAKGDKYGVITSECIECGCNGLFLTETERDQFLKEEFGFGNYLGLWTSKNTLRCQVVAALRKIGRPASKEELAELLNHPTQNVGSVLGSIEGIVRADRYRWGFDEWIDDAYDGIFGEIEQRINEYNGSVPIHILMTEIPSQFDVSENSVRAYISSSAFVVDNGMVRMASNDEYVPRSPSRCADAVRIDDRWGYRSLIYDRHFHGYSLGVSFDVAFANGLRPGDNLIVPIEGSNEEVSLIWRASSINRLVDVGRVSNYLLARGYKAGETLILIPSREKIEIIHERDLQTRFPKLVQQSLFDDTVPGQQSADDLNNAGIHDPLFDLLGGDQ